MLWNKKLTMIIRATVAAAALSWLAPQAIAETPVKVGINPWIGYGPWYIAKEKGFDKANGVDI